MKFLSLGGLIGTILLIGGCGAVGNTVISDSSLQQKAAFALNTTADKVTVSNRTSTIDSIRFNAQAGGKVYQCYITTVMGAISSDALCSGTDGKAPKGGQCNQLLKAAGKC